MPRPLRLIFICSLSSILLILFQAAPAATFADRATFEAAVTGEVIEGFESFLPATNLTVLNAADFEWLKTGAVDFDVVDPGLTGNRALKISQDAVGYEYTVTLDSPATAFGFDIDGINSGSITLYADGNFIGGAGSSNSFFGFTSDTEFTTVVMERTSSSGAITFDNVTYNVVPAPAAPLLAAIAVPALILRRWRSGRGGGDPTFLY